MAITKFATGVKGDVHVKPGIVSIDGVTLLVEETWTITVDEGGVDDGSIGQNDWWHANEVGTIFLLECTHD